MKTLLINSTVLVLITLSGCRTKDLSFAKFKSSETVKEHLSLDENRSVSEKGMRVIDFQDSGKLFVGLRIYPLDTFSLSVNQGFKGRASLIEYVGLKEGVIRLKDSSVLAANEEHKFRYVRDTKGQKTAVSKMRELRKKSLRNLAWILIVGLVVLNIWVWWRKGKSGSLLR